MDAHEESEMKSKIKYWVMSLRPWPSGAQMGEWAEILILLLRTLLAELLLYTQSHTRGFPRIVPWFWCRHDYSPISQMRQLRFRDVNSLAQPEMDLGCQLRQTMS